MSSTYEAWQSGRPIYSRLPGVNEGYRKEEGEPIADWLTVYFDELLIATKTTVGDLPRQLNPATCDPAWLDFLRLLCGFTGEYWDKAWSDEVKRSLIANAFDGVDIWANKGSEVVLAYLLELFDIDHEVWLGASFLVGISELPGTLGSPEWVYYLLLPLKYLRESSEFKLAEKLNRLYSPAFCDSLVCYDAFYVGFSACGDPVFEA
ncbi:hypothetical protein IQ268_08820 [Oculatella sp. LEGE 06141]|uniref:phage tail protein n=1 Tax=Oculatella sp. LEGE 06141 TaxID=1828648 RepID=UPI00188110B3|nr:phage tail protein [Oculatella sp. LEGE 06141]MBE9178660.1 hypothetical protein [Oculatella sp. LEGE 06141]